VDAGTDASTIGPMQLIVVGFGFVGSLAPEQNRMGWPC
jgi:hypothetical protein